MGAHAGIIAEYGDWIFRVYAWQKGSYLATAHNSSGDSRTRGNNKGEIGTEKEGKSFCEAIHQVLRSEDRKNGITRG